MTQKKTVTSGTLFNIVRVRTGAVAVIDVMPRASAPACQGCVKVEAGFDRQGEGCHDQSMATLGVLLVEDDEAISAPLARGLSREGYAVTLATDGPAGLAAGTSPQVALVILD